LARKETEKTEREEAAEAAEVAMGGGGMVCHHAGVDAMEALNAAPQFTPKFHEFQGPNDIVVFLRAVLKTK